ncbi:MAG TPA: GerAB/ArcD/ProY family transporter [Verrucomicrobiae bacterium]|nr:GerAB/ArcD/ProY family transporter [Verrucomicrobiae bacterium]
MKEKISGRQATFLSMGVLLGTIFLPTGQTLAACSGRDGWMVIFPGFFASFPFVYLVLYINNKLGGDDLFTGIKKLITPWLGIPLLIAYSLTSISFAGLLLRQGSELFIRSLMVETPLSVFLVGEILLLFLIICCGFEAFARFVEVMVGPIYLSLVFLIVFAIPKAELGYLKPYLYNGVAPLAKGLITLFPWGFEYILFLLILLPRLNKPHEITRGARRAYLTVCLILTGITVVEFCVLSPEESARLFYGAMSLARMTEIGKTVRGLEPFFVVFWFGANIIKISAFYFCALFAAQAIYTPKRRSIWPILIGGGILTVSYVPKDSIEMIKMIANVDKYMILPLAAGSIPFLACIVWLKARWKNGKLS